MRRMIVAILFVCSVAFIVNADFDWATYWYFYDTGGTFLTNNTANTVGVFAQLIWDVDDDGIDPANINYTTGIDPASDDVVYMASWFGDGGAGNPGQFTTVTVTAGDPQTNGTFYARVWSAPVGTWSAESSQIPTGATYWDAYTDGQGAVLGFEYPGAFTTYSMSGPNGSPYSANITASYSPVPEPSSFLLATAGLFLVRLIRRKK